MRQTQIKTSKANTFHNDLFATFAHELKTPITSIKEAISILIDMDKLKFDPKTKRILTIAHEETNRLIRMIDNFLKISAYEVGKIQLHLEKAKINEIINQVIESQSITIKRKNLRIKKHLAPNLPNIIIDKDRIFEVIANLLDNALKFTPEYGVITITTQIFKSNKQTEFPPNLISNQKYLKFTISDTGPGISKKNLPRIFQKFERLETENKPGGVGLGLAIAKNIVELHNGKIWVTSQKRKGATFHFVIPISNQVS